MKYFLHEIEDGFTVNTNSDGAIDEADINDHRQRLEIDAENKKLIIIDKVIDDDSKIEEVRKELNQLCNEWNIQELELLIGDGDKNKGKGKATNEQWERFKDLYELAKNGEVTDGAEAIINGYELKAPKKKIISAMIEGFRWKLDDLLNEKKWEEVLDAIRKKREELNA